jgi:carbamate kinase
MRLVIALGGNALLPRGMPPDEIPQLARVAKVAIPLARLAEQHEVVLVHGNGPQVGLLARETAADDSLARPYPFDDLVAETQGLIGYWLQQALGHHLTRPVVTLVTQTVVDPDDPAFSTPTKFVGAIYDEATATALTAERGWAMARDGAAWRRVVASPAPLRIIEVSTAGALLTLGTTVVMAGGGGVPVVETDHGLSGVDAVVDKDLVAAELAADLGADLLMVLTDVSHVMHAFGTTDQRPIRDVTVADLDPTAFAAGSMGPKVAAVVGFVRRTGARAAVGSLDDVAGIFAGDTGTQIRPGPGTG